ncbi:MAG: hypothetical protein QOE70_1094 [Chthoniobacter sp.]|jgi:hypothetical protein|nr:hypothetical protein [Chthoniobacter sp.]
MFRVALLVCFLALPAPSGRAEDFQGSTHPVPYDEPPVNYSAATPADPIARLQARLDSHEVKLRFDNEFGWLPALLEALKVPRSSQMLVFSKTSLQRPYITPENPRALYYNDDVYLGYIPGAPMMELSAVDPKLGGIFYSIEQLPARKPVFTRQSDCLRCHAAPRTMGVPGHVLRSIGTDATGEIDTQNELGPVNQTLPLAARWAGWFVTGQHGAQPHRGNLIGPAAFTLFEEEPLAKGNLRELGEFFDEKKYLERGSDIVALMVLEHQTHMHNYITRLNYETQHMMASYGHIRYLTSQVNAFLRFLLFTEETPLTEPIAGNPAFVEAFTAQGPRDAKGRSLRDLDLQTRMFKYPCSYLIYSPAFDQLPAVMRDHLLQRLWEILSGTDKTPDFARIPADQRHEILEILRATKPGLPDYWKES